MSDGQRSAVYQWRELQKQGGFKAASYFRRNWDLLPPWNRKEAQ